MFLSATDPTEWDVNARLDYIKQHFHDSDLQQNVQFVKTKTRSKLAQSFIIDAYMEEEWNDASTRPISFVSATQRWLQDIKYGGRLHQLKRDAENRFPGSMLDQTIYFVVHVMHFFNFGRVYSAENVSPCCKYTKGKFNFIRKLLTRKECNCVCFATYVLAICEEFGLDRNVSLCLEPGHVSVIVIDPTHSQESELDAIQLQSVTANITLFDFPSTVQSGDVFLKPLIVAKIESSCDQVIIRTILENFESRFVPNGIKSDSFGIVHVDQIDTCQNDVLNFGFTFMIYEICAAYDVSTIFPSLLLAADIFNMHAWVDAFLRVTLCAIEIEWLTIYISGENFDDAAWERYFILRPGSTMQTPLSKINARSFQKDLMFELHRLRLEWYAMLDPNAELNNLTYLIPLPTVVSLRIVNVADMSVMSAPFD